MSAGFEHIVDWVFDLDNTLYSRECNLFAQIDRRITQYVMNARGMDPVSARALQKEFYRDYGTTLNGLMILDGIDPDHYLDFVHDIDYSPVKANADLMGAIAALPGRKFIFTNADVKHSQSVLNNLGGRDLFDGIFDIKASDYQPKPMVEAYAKFFKDHNIQTDRAIMFDDLHKNLFVPHNQGMKTVQVVAGEGFMHTQVENWEMQIGHELDHVHYITRDLVQFLHDAA